MPGNGKVFISFAPEDAERFAALRVALDAWSVDHWFTNGRLTAERQVSRRTLKVISERDIFIRVCTPAAVQLCLRVQRETEAFEALQAEDRCADAAQRLLINLVLEEPAEALEEHEGAITISAARRFQPTWLAELRQALGISLQRATAAARQDTMAHLTQPLVAHAVKREVPAQIRRSGRLLGGDPSQPTTIYLEAWMPLPALDPEPAANGGARIRTIASLVTLQGRVHGHLFTLRQPKTTLGRSLERDIFFEDIAVSRLHASIQHVANDIYRLHDEHSKNGTYVNGERVTTHLLSAGDLIRIGNCVLCFQYT